jgi:TPR repeat protein
MAEGPRWRFCAVSNLASARLAFAALLAASLSSPPAAGAGQPASATPAAQAPSASRSVAELRAAAAGGSVEAEYELAERLAIDGIDEHRSEAVVWLKKAAAEGHAGAQTHLSWAYHLGVGVPSNDFEAVKWERLAAEKNQESAQFYLGYWPAPNQSRRAEGGVQPQRWMECRRHRTGPAEGARSGQVFFELRSRAVKDRW